jgi:hypothetical protein
MEHTGAAEAVSKYLDALRVSDPVVRDRVTTRVLERVEERAKPVAAPSPTLALQELDQLMTEWFADVFGEPQPTEDAARLSARGRLALLLADLPGRWQAQFLQPGPWPTEFISAMRESYLHTRPDDHLSDMQPEPIDLGPIATLTRLSRLPYYRILLVWLAFALLLVVVFRLTH